MEKRNMIRCKQCGDIIESRYTHHFVTCSCGTVSVDGGTDYLKRYGSFGDWEELSVGVDMQPKEYIPQVEKMKPDTADEEFEKWFENRRKQKPMFPTIQEAFLAGCQSKVKHLEQKIAELEKENEKLKNIISDRFEEFFNAGGKLTMLFSGEKELATLKSQLEVARELIEHNIDDVCNCNEKRICVYHQFLKSVGKER